MTRLLAPALAAVAAFGLLLSAPVLAKPGRGGPQMEPTAEMKAVHALKKQIAAEELAVALNLAPAQKQELSTLIQGVLSARDDARETRSDAAEAATPILERYLAEVRANGAASEKTLEAVRGLRADRNEGREAKMQQREAVKESLKGILSPEQFEALAKFRPMSEVGPDPERKEQRMERRERRKQRTREFAAENDGDPETLDAVRDGKRRRGMKKKARHTIQRVLFSEEMLDALAR